MEKLNRTKWGTSLTKAVDEAFETRWLIDSDGLVTPGHVILGLSSSTELNQFNSLLFCVGIDSTEVRNTILDGSYVMTDELDKSPEDGISFELYSTLLELESLENRKISTIDFLHKVFLSKSDLSVDLRLNIKDWDKFVQQLVDLKESETESDKGNNSNLISGDAKGKGTYNDHTLFTSLQSDDKEENKDELKTVLSNLGLFTTSPSTSNIVYNYSGGTLTQTNDTPQGSIDYKKKYPLLSKTCINMTESAESGGFGAVIGRGIELDNVIRILARKKKSNPILVGEAGVGKTSIVEGLAMKIHGGEVPSCLLGSVVFELRMSDLVSGTKFRGEFEERLSKLLDEAEKNPEVILFIDEIHTMIGTGSSGGSLDVANIMKPALAKGSIKCIGATTYNEFRETIEKDGALDRRFSRVDVKPTTESQTLEILNLIKSYYEDHHKVSYSDEAINQCVKLAERYLPSKNFPDKAIDLLDESGARVHVDYYKVSPKLQALKSELEANIINKESAVNSQNFELAASLRSEELELQSKIKEEMELTKRSSKDPLAVVTELHVARVISNKLGIPADKILESDFETVMNLADKLKSKLVGQDTAIEEISNCIKRSRVGISDPDKPLGSFIFSGQTGVGKTQLTKLLAKELTSNMDSLLRIDMSEYMDRYSSSKLLGTGPGYVGYGDGGQLTEKVRQNPYSVILLDEIEKAHKDVLNIFLQVLDAGHLTDGAGRHVDFRNTIIVMTTNIGASLSPTNSGFGYNSSESIKTYSEKVSEIKSLLVKSFSPEFINRVDSVIHFNELTESDIIDIAKLEVSKLTERLKSNGYIISIDNSVYEFLSTIGYDKKNGARPMKRAIQDHLEIFLTNQIISGTLSKDTDTVLIYSDKFELN